MKRLSNLLLVVVLLVTLTACGSGRVSMEGSYNGGYSDGFAQGPTLNSTAQSDKAGFDLGGLFGSSNSSSSGGGSYDMDYAPEYAGERENDSGYDSDDGNVQGGETINRDMLVYRGSVSITTKEYEKAVSNLSELFSKYDCFIESSREYSNYRYSDGVDLMTYEATIRVNSASYDEFMHGVSDLGVVKSTSSTVQNMNVEYSDTVTALRIKQARLDRYLDLLENERDTEIALQLEREIANIQIELQQLENRKALIETDVAYSYVTLTISEVKAYTSQVTHDDPLHVRLWAEIVNTYYEFTEFLTNLLFFCVHAFPYFVLIAIVIIVLKKVFKFKIRLPRLFKRRSLRRHADAEDKTKGGGDSDAES